MYFSSDNVAERRSQYYEQLMTARQTHFAQLLRLLCMRRVSLLVAVVVCGKAATATTIYHSIEKH
jgi:hypothetical protein